MRGHVIRRLAALLILVPLLLAACHFTRQIYLFIRIFTPHSGVALTQEQVQLAHNSSSPDKRPQPVPKLIHQIYHNWTDPLNDDVPGDWDSVRRTCTSKHKEWAYRLWTARTSRIFIAEQYPNFLATYDALPHPVQRTDALRYFLMLHYGGIYIDLDNGCAAPLDALLYYPSWVTDGGKGALSNNILGAEPGHPFWRLLTERLASSAKRRFPLPYLDVSYATGQWFETAVWEEYHRSKAGRERPLTRVMMDMDPKAAKWVYFTQERGGTWNQWDNEVFKWIGDHVLLIIVCVSGVLGLIWGLGLLLLRLAQRVLRVQRERRLDMGKPDRAG